MADDQVEDDLLLSADQDLAKAPSTVCDYIKGVVLKEIWAVQLSRSPGQFNPEQARDLVNRVGAQLSNDILDSVRGFIDLPHSICITSLLPDLDQHPASADDE